MQADYLIVGGGIAAARAVEGIRARDPAGRIVMVTEEPDPPYFRPLISYLLAGKVEPEALPWRPESFWSRQGVERITGCRVVSLDGAARAALLADGREIGFGRLLLATGSRPLLPPLPGRDLPGVFTFTTWQDVRSIQEYLNARQPERAVVIGGGLIGLKAAEALAALGIKVAVVELKPYLLPTGLDPEGASFLEAHLRRLGWECLPGRGVAAIEGRSRVTGVSLDDGTVLDADLAVVATGVRANVELARAAGLAVEQGIVVNEYLETGQPGIYAAGDAAQAPEALSGQPRVLALWPVAGGQGFTAGLNLAGERRACRPGVPMNATSLAGLSLVTVGRVEAPAEEGFTELVRADRESGYYRKLVFREERLVGAVLIGQVARAGLLTGLIRSGLALPEAVREGLLLGGAGLLDLPEAYWEGLRAWARRGGGQVDAA
ncbi:MAG: FAD-dependent oxidoreductase [Clostridia bacterium]|jgi:NAD(P)H-nitrite reductase large subunit|nr:FAD-dependent oxidoreductase [Clostridia bacterium]MDH7573939.1 FAD-dependent oxidoreductase [Clostridia bacterium]